MNGPVATLRHRLTHKAPYRCSTCGWIGWVRGRHRHIEHVVGKPPVGPEPDLTAIDRELGAGKK